jgi:hypothetical protein
MDFLKAIPAAFYAAFRLLIKVFMFFGLLFFLFIPAFFLSVIPGLLFDWGPGLSIGISYVVVILVYIGYRMNKR